VQPVGPEALVVTAFQWTSTSPSWGGWVLLPFWVAQPEAGAAGVVVSGDDVGTVRDALGRDAILVVPGVRPGGQPANDHARILTPGEALERGADYIVVGRPITQSPDPAGAARGVLREVGFEA